MKLKSAFLLFLLLTSSVHTLSDVGGDNEILDLGKDIFENLLPLLGLTYGDMTSILSIVKVGLGIIDFVDLLSVKLFNGTSINMSWNWDQMGAPEHVLLGYFKSISDRMTVMHHGTEGVEVTLRDLVRALPHLVRWEIALDTLEGYMRPINSLYQLFESYQQKGKTIEDYTLLDFAESVLSHETDSIQSLMSHINSLVSPDSYSIKGRNLDGNINAKVSADLAKVYKAEITKQQNGKLQNSELERFYLRPSVFQMLLDALQEYEDCRLFLSPQQLVLGLYTNILLTQAKGYAMMNYAWMLLRVYNEGNFTVEQELAKERYNFYSEQLMKEALDILVKTSSTFFRCDPKVHVEGETYAMFTELLQGYIENEVDMDTTGSCRHNCHSYQHSETKRCYRSDTQICGRQKQCQGTIHQCRYFDADATVCMSSHPYRRYDWIEYEDTTLVGKKTSCENSTLLKVDSWWRFLFHCSYCFCLCDDPSSLTSYRYVSLLPVESDVAENKVITGIKLIMHNGVLQFQIQEGKALPQAAVNSSTLRWQSPQSIYVHSGKERVGIDYAKLTYEGRSMDMDRLTAPPGHIVTGVKFRLLGSHVNLEIKVSPVNFTTGSLKHENSYWISNDSTPSMHINPRKEILLENYKLPNNAKLPLTRTSAPNSFVTFVASSTYEDASQFTVPFFDILSVAPYPTTWLSGIELFHKSIPGNAGFVSLKIQTYSLIKHFNQYNPKIIGKIIKK